MASFIDECGVEYSANKKKLLKFPNDFVGQYAIPEGVTTIEAGAFNGCRKLKRLYFPGTLKKVEYNAFVNCKTFKMMFPDWIDQQYFTEMDGIKQYLAEKENGDMMLWNGNYGEDMKTVLTDSYSWIFTVIATIVIFVLLWLCGCNIILAIFISPVAAVLALLGFFTYKWIETYS